MIDKTIYVEDEFGFFQYTLHITAKYHAAIKAEIKDGIPTECDSEAYIEIYTIKIDGESCTLDRASEWIGISSEKLETIISDNIKNDIAEYISSLPF
jgi:hypothetical protein